MKKAWQKIKWNIAWLFAAVGLFGGLFLLMGGKDFIRELNKKFPLDTFAMYFGYVAIFVSLMAVAFFAKKEADKLSD